MPALTQHACFSCRKVFKKPTPYASAVARGTAARTSRCPQCSAALVNMGHKFRAPPMDDVGEWQRIERCVAGGVPYGTPTRRKTRRKGPGEPEVTPALRKALGFNTKSKRRGKRAT
jgi:hypothetical protein